MNFDNVENAFLVINSKSTSRNYYLLLIYALRGIVLIKILELSLQTLVDPDEFEMKRSVVDERNSPNPMVEFNTLMLGLPTFSSLTQG